MSPKAEVWSGAAHVSAAVFVGRDRIPALSRKRNARVWNGNSTVPSSATSTANSACIHSSGKRVTLRDVPGVHGAASLPIDDATQRSRPNNSPNCSCTFAS